MLDERLMTTDSAAEAHFRARLKARDGVRPQSTLAILAGLDPKKATPDVPRGPVRVAPAPARPLRTAPVMAAPVMTPPAPAPVRAPAPPPQPASRPFEVPENRAPLPAPVPVPAPAPRPEPVREIAEIEAEAEPAATEGDQGDGRSYGELAFAGLALLGIAGLAFMAGDRILNGDRRAATSEGDTRTATSEGTTALAGASAVSATAVQEAAMPAGVDPAPWFDYRGVADYLKARVEAFQEAEREAARQLELEAERIAAAALADAEAQRLAAAAQAAAEAEAAAEAAAAAERERLAREEADRIAALEAQRLAEAEANAAAARAEADRVAALEAQRAAEALAEQQRLAELEARNAAEAAAREQAEIAARQAAADAEARRLAEVEARREAAAAEERRMAELEAQRAADAEARRLAEIEARQAAEAAEARRLAEIEAQRLADAARAAERQATPAPTLAAVVLPPPAPAVKPSVPPGAASLKPAHLSGQQPVTREAPPALIAANPEIRPIGVQAPAALRTADAFMGDRVALTAAAPMSPGALAGLKAQFLGHVETAADGGLQVLTTPDGRQLEIRFEHSMNRAPVTRAYAAPMPITVSVMCRDVVYALPGQERGRFAACKSADGSWVMQRPSEPEASSA